MECIIRPSPELATQLVAQIISRELRANPQLILGLATGRTMESLYRMLVQMHREEGLDFSQCRTFNLDEYVGLPGTDRHSYRHYMEQHLFQQVNILPENTHLPDGMAEDPDAESRRYETRIAEVGGIDLQLLGLGQSGHIGFNEPLSALKSRTRVKALSPATIAQNAPLFENPSEMPRRAITMGIGTILDCRRCVLLTTGTAKAKIVTQAIEGPITAMISATALQLHERCTVVVDKEAAQQLRGADYYQWIFENEPEWRDFH